MYEMKPWLQFYGDIPESLDYPRVTMYEALMKTVARFPQRLAFDFLDYTSTYEQFARDIDTCSRALAALGLKKGERITISMPTSPQALICFYAANKLGAVSSMIHPLSTATEIAYYLNISKSRFALTLVEFYDKFRQVKDDTPLETLVLTGILDCVDNAEKAGANGSHPDPMVRWWHDLIKASYPEIPGAKMGTDDLAVILYSGGTTGVPKGIMLTNYNFITEGMMVFEWWIKSVGGIHEQPIILAILPIFHGFGLGICCNAMLMGGGRCILVPQFTPEIVADLVARKHPSFLTGVPTLYDALSTNPIFQNADLSCLKTATCGADTLPRAVKERFEDVVRKGGGNVTLMEGYGLTEAVTGIMITPIQAYREGSVGVPLPDMLAKVVRIGTKEEAVPGEEGELCLSGPAVMQGYLENTGETDETLKKHADERLWLHTGDIFTMDKDGYFYFKLRLKRMIKSSGMNVYPAQVENILYQHPDVAAACVIGVPDEKQVERVKAFVVLKDSKKAGREMADNLINFCRDRLIKWSCPRELEFRENLPLTRVGKIAFNELEKEEIAKLKKDGKYIGNK